MRLLFWNAWALMMRDDKARRRKLAYFSSVLQRTRADVAVIAECHGLYHELDRDLRLLSHIECRRLYQQKTKPVRMLLAPCWYPVMNLDSQELPSYFVIS